MHPSVIADALPPSLAGKALRTAAPLKASPCRGGGCAVRRRRRGTALSWAFTPAVWQALAAGWPCRIACWRVVCPPKPSAPLRRGRCQRCPATPAAAPMLPGGRSRPPPGACRIARWRVVWTQSQARPCAGDDACIVPQPLRRLQCCPAGEIARRKTFRSMRFFGSMFTFTRKPSASHQPLRKGRGIPAGANAPSARFFEHAPGVRTAEIPHS